MNLLQALILSIVEGITEFLPISSTAHLILTSHLLQIEPSNFLTTFEIAIQLGAIGAVVLLYFKRLITQKSLFLKACVGFIPTGILGFLFYDGIKQLFGNPLVPVISLFLGGIAIIGIERLIAKKNRDKSHEQIRKIEQLSYKDAILIGFVQSISMIPGVSRAASSTFGGLALKFDRRAAVEFSFILAIPTMIAATALDILQSASSLGTYDVFILCFGILFSFISAFFVIKWLIGYIQKNDFTVFGIYRIILSIVYYLLFLR